MYRCIGISSWQLTRSGCFGRRFSQEDVKCQLLTPLPSWFGGYPLIRIDHVFINSLVRVSDVHVPRTRLERAASDHLPLVVDVRLPDLPDLI